MAKSSELLEPSAADPRPDWRVLMLESYRRDGFEIIDIVPKPPERPTRRIAEHGGSTYDYDSAFLPFDSAGDEAWAAKYAAMIVTLGEKYEVRTASPTPEMVENDPSLILEHVIVFGRPLAS